MGMKPTHTLSVLNKDTQARANLGVAWLDSTNGSIAIKLNPCVILDGNKEEIMIKLFPLHPNQAAQYSAERPYESKTDKVNRAIKKGKEALEENDPPF